MDIRGKGRIRAEKKIEREREGKKTDGKSCYQAFFPQLLKIDEKAWSLP